MNGPTSRSMAAVLAVLGEGATADVEDRLAALGPAHWRRLSRLVADHRVGPVFLHGLDERGLTHRVPDAVIAGCRRSARAVLARNLTHLRDRSRVGAALAQAGVPILWLKGAVLVDDVYPNPGLRPMADLDLLLRPEDLRTAVAALAPLGFRLREPDLVARLLAGEACELHLDRDRGPVQLDVHVAVKNHGASWRQDLTAQLWREATPHPRAPEVGLIPGPLTHFLFLVRHAAVQHSLCRLSQLVDLHRVLATRGGGWTWADLVARAAPLGLERALGTTIVALDDLLAAGHAARLGLSAERVESLRAGGADLVATAFRHDRVRRLAPLLPLSEYWSGKPSLRAACHLLDRARLARRGPWQGTMQPAADPTPGRVPVHTRIAFRVRVLAGLAGDLPLALRFLRFQGRLRQDARTAVALSPADQSP